jgi:hypothetical protein
MAWVTWRQHRPQLLTAAGFVVLVAVAAFISDFPISAAYHRHALASCLPPSTRSGCDLIVNHFRSQFAPSTGAVRWLAVVPALAGVFVGAPLLAREYEHGTFRLAWTQGVSRSRWLLSKTALLAGAVVLAATVLALVVMWWRRPFDNVDGRIIPSVFDIEGLVVPAYSFFALAAGVLAGVVLRRTIPAMTVAAATFIATRVGVELGLRPHFAAPLHRVAGGLTPTDAARNWVLDNHLVDALGRQITAAREDLAVAHAQHAGIDPQSYIVSLGWHRLVTYQPASRFWSFQLIEFAIFACLGLVAVGLAVFLARREPA